MKLPRKFFEKKTLRVAKELLGCFLIRRIGRRKIVARIIETEAYCGPKDLANHASKGRTPRTEIMFGQAGYAYVYLIYGMYYCFNVVTERVNYPAAVLIRGMEINGQKIIGPGKVCRELEIDKKLNGLDLIKSQKLWIENRRLMNQNLESKIEDRRAKANQQKFNIISLPRVGVDYAGEYKNKPWRFGI